MIPNDTLLSMQQYDTINLSEAIYCIKYIETQSVYFAASEKSGQCGILRTVQERLGAPPCVVYNVMGNEVVA